MANYESTSCQSIIVSSGSTSALTVAFNDLKKRYLQRQSDILEVQNRNLKMNAELQQMQNETQILERKIEQLQKNLQSKTMQLRNLEATFHRTRENEDSLIKHSAETERLLEEVIYKLRIRDKENEQLNKEIRITNKKVLDLTQQKQLLEKEVEDLKHIPQVSVLKHEPVASNNSPPIPPRHLKPNSTGNDRKDSQLEELQKEYKSVLLENKNLRTTIHWLDKNLKATKMQGFGGRPCRIRRDSDSLEEGKKQSTCTEKKSTNKVDLYIERMHQMIIFLQQSLKSNTALIDKLLRNRSRGKGKNSISLFKSSKTNVEHRESSVANQIVERGASNNLQIVPQIEDTVECHNPMSAKILKHQSRYPHMWKQQLLTEYGNYVDIEDIRNLSDLSTTQDLLNNSLGEINLPPSLIQNVKQQQTQTYLKTKTLSPRFPSIYMQDDLSHQTAFVLSHGTDLEQVNSQNLKESQPLESYMHSEIACVRNSRLPESNLSEQPSEVSVQQNFSPLHSPPNYSALSQNPGGNSDENAHFLEAIFKTDGGSIVSQDDEFIN